MASYTQAMIRVASALEALSVLPAAMQENTDLLREMNSEIKRNRQDIAVVNQWRSDHASTTHDALEKRMDRVAGKVSIVGTINAVLTALVGAVIGFRE